jgi:hypothetical protein
MSPEDGRAWMRAALVVATLLRAPGAGAATTTPLGKVEVAGVRTLVARPRGAGPFPAIVFANAAHEAGSAEPVARTLIEALARSGFVVLAPELPGLRRGEITEATLQATTELVREAAGRPDLTTGRVALVGASTGAALSILAAADPALADRVSVVGAVAPFADLENVFRLATTGFYARDGCLLAYPVVPRLAVGAARSLALTLPAGPGRTALLDALPAADDLRGDPLARLSLPSLDRDAAAVAALLANRDPRRFDGLFRALPARTRALTEALSPVRVVGRLGIPVEIAVGPKDRYFPPVECEALAKSGPTVRLTVTATLDHARPRLVAHDVRDAARFAHFVARVLEEAARPVRPAPESTAFRRSGAKTRFV